MVVRVHLSSTVAHVEIVDPTRPLQAIVGKYTPLTRGRPVVQSHYRPPPSIHLDRTGRDGQSRNRTPRLGSRPLVSSDALQPSRIADAATFDAYDPHGGSARRAESQAARRRQRRSRHHGGRCARTGCSASWPCFATGTRTVSSGAAYALGVTTTRASPSPLQAFRQHPRRRASNDVRTTAPVTTLRVVARVVWKQAGWVVSGWVMVARVRQRGQREQGLRAARPSSAIRRLCAW
jgi:hypothetical protein